MKAQFPNLDEIANTPLLTFGETSITISNIFFFVLVLVLTLLINSGVRKMMTRLRQEAEDESRSNIYVLERALHYIILAMGIIISLSALGVDMTHLALLATALSVGIGFGLQSIFNNFFSGIIVLLEKSIKVGDYIEVGTDVAGEVKEINIRSTLVRTNDNLDILIPNSEFVNGRVTNWTLGDPYRRLRVGFGVAYGSNKDLVKEAALEAAGNVHFTATGKGKEPDVWLVNFGDSSIDFELIVWVDPRKNDQPGILEAKYLWEIHSSLERYNIEIPFPQRDIHIKSDEELPA